ncbi:ArsB/NhaD family transporter [Mariprofundus sp. NF]|uniref:SLC13 family permease n=1 Tax=Mariprofundus sp. NF TaxID=2608716 RepID=UPI0015A1F76B|nr:ArsB/NhaD family transporter [Mariprofundus sp. NF]NWF38912.1 ArsB/NhaD family transporter [Mariprofundus sp. NF]
MAEYATELTFDMYIALAVMLGAYVLIFSEVLHRTSAAIIGAVVMIGVGTAVGFYSQDMAIQAIDGNTILLLTAMMMVVAMLRPTGAFEYVAVILSKASRGDSRLLLIYLSLAVSIISMFLDNVTTVIIFAPITVLIARILEVNPLPFLMAEAMLSNIGGAATLVGDPPNIMIGTAGGIDFTRFIVHMGPTILLVWFCTVLLILFLFRKHLPKVDRPVDLDESKAIHDSAGLKRSLFALAVIIGLFFVHHILGIYPAYAAFVGLCIVLLLEHPEPGALFGQVNWSVLAFFVGLFIIVGGVEKSGLLHWVGLQLVDIARNPEGLLITGLAVMWCAALLSAIVDNIPFTVTIIPIVLGLESMGINITPLWWALAIGVGLGGNGTHIGATANLIAIAESERCGIRGAAITPMAWMKVGIPTMFFSLIVASLVYSLFFSTFL